MAPPRQTSYQSYDFIDELDNSPESRKAQVAEKVTTIEGFYFERPGVILERSSRNAELAAALAKDAHQVSRETAETRVVEYVKGLLLAANRLWHLVDEQGKRQYYTELANSPFNQRHIVLPRNQIEQLLPALVHAREHFLVRVATQTNAPPTEYTAPSNMTEAAAQYLLVRMTEIRDTRGFVFKGVPMAAVQKAEARDGARPVGQAAQNNRRGTKLSDTFVQAVVPITQMGRQSGRSTIEWFALIDHIGATGGGSSGSRRG